MNDVLHDTNVSAEHEVRMLRSRAKSLTQQASSLPDPLALTYRRRARELTLEAYLLEQAVLTR